MSYLRRIPAIAKPISASKIVPDQGFDMAPQVLPLGEHLLRYPMKPPIPAPAIPPIAYISAMGIDFLFQ